MQSNMQVVELTRAMVPVSQFNKGAAAKIFDEVSQTGIKIVVKNNKPACILLSPERFATMMEEMEDLQLALEAGKRIAENGATISFEDVLSQNNMGEADLDGWEEVEIE